MEDQRCIAGLRGSIFTDEKCSMGVRTRVFLDMNSVVGSCGLPRKPYCILNAGTAGTGGRSRARAPSNVIRPSDFLPNRHYDLELNDIFLQRGWRSAEMR